MNTLDAKITAVTSSQHLSCIRVCVENEPFHLLLAEASNEADLLHTHVTLAFKETEVILAKTMEHSTANSHRGTVKRIERGIVLTQVILNYHDSTITALVATITFDMLGIQCDDTISWMVQPSEISLLRGSNGI